MAWIWHTPEEIARQSKYPSIVGVAMSLTVVMVAVVLTRLYVRWRIVNKLGNDDYVTFVAAIISVVYNSLAVWQTRMGLGLIPPLRPKEEMARYNVVNFTSRPLYMLVVTGFKVALCLAYLRILTGTQSVFRKVTIGLLAFIVVSHLVATLLIVFQCKPVSKSWRPEEDGKCLEDFPTWIGTASVTIVCDLFTFLLPVPLFFSLQISTRRKVVLSMLFVMGFFTTACSIMRMIQIWQIPKTGDNSPLVLWAVAEMNVGISLSCAPALKPLFDRLSSSEATPLGGYGGYPSSGMHSDLYSKQRTSVQLQSLPRAARRNESEEDMLPLQGIPAESHAIRKTVEYTVQEQ